MADRPLRVGLVGAGMVAEHHVRAWKASAGGELIAVCDPDPARASSRAALFGGRSYLDLDEMLASEPLDALDIIAPASLHVPLILAGTDRNLAVMCQKPLAPTAAEASVLMDRLPAGARVMVHENWRWRAPYRALADALALGQVQPVVGFDFRVASSGLLRDADGRYPALERQPFFARLDRFLVIEVLVHHLDTLVL